MSTVKLALVTELRGHLKGGGLKGQLLRGGIGSIAVKIANTGLAFLLAVLLARTLGPEGYGIYSFAFALISLMAIPSQLGLPQLMIRETAKAQANEKWGLLRGLWRWSSLAVWGFSSLVAFVALAGIWFFGDSIGDTQRFTLLIGLFLVPLVALGNLRGAALRGLSRVVLGQLPEGLIRPAVQFLLVGISWWLVGSVTPISTMLLHVVAAAAAFIIGAVLLWRAKPQALEANPSPQYQSRQWLVSALPLALITGLQLVNNQADVIMLGIIGTSEEVGVYKVVVTSSTLVSFGLQAIHAVMSPYFAKFYSNNEMGRLQWSVTISTRASLAMALPVGISFVLFGGFLLGLVFGDSYSSGHVALIILSIGQLVNVSVGLVGLLLIMTGNEKHSLIFLTFSSVVNIALNMLLIPLYGIEGAAIATAIALISWNICLCIMVKKKLNINMSPF